MIYHDNKFLRGSYGLEFMTELLSLNIYKRVNNSVFTRVVSLTENKLYTVPRKVINILILFKYLLYLIFYLKLKTF